jgi:tRNA 2-thiouridine synthesizing protein A
MVKYLKTSAELIGTCTSPSSDTTMNNVTINKDLDVKGLNCPLPILRAKKALTDMESGQVLRVVATDPGSVKDFAAFCKQTGNPLLSSEETASAFTFLISKR